MKKQWKRLAALSSAVIMAAGTLLYFPTDTLQNISWGITASAEETGAETWNEGNLTWTLTADGTMTISGSGAMKGYSWYSGSPATQKKDNVKKVVIQEGVTSIGNSAFYNCSNLKSIEIPEGVTSIGAFAFYNCGGLTSIEIPETVKSIGNGAFAGCGGLTSLEIPSGVTSIGDNTFSGCSSLTDITIPDSVTSIGNSAFSGCSSLTDITIPESVTNIEDSAFEYCSSLTGITIPESVTSIERYAFRNCTGLKSITIPKSVESVGDEAFSGCTALTEVLLEGGSTLTSESFGEVADKVVTRWNEDSLIWTLAADGTMTISGTGTMKNYSNDSPATQKKDNIKKVVIEDGVTSIGDCAFSGTLWLTNKQHEDSLVIVNGILIDGTACSGEVTIPNDVTSIGEGAFQNCTVLSSITIPGSVTIIG